MTTNQSQIVGAGVAFLLIFASGFLMSSAGYPPDTLIFTVHKLVGVALLAFLAVTGYRKQRSGNMNALELTITALAFVSFVATIVAGGLLSIESTRSALAQSLHQILPFLTVPLTIASIYVLARRQPAIS